jgi:hypothetical protein
MLPNTNQEQRKLTKIPVPALILLGIAAFSAVLLVVCIFNSSFASFLNGYFCGFFRFILAKVTDIFPFSLAELLIILLPVALIILIIYVIKKGDRSARAVITYFVSLLSAVSLVFTAFVFTFAPGYHTPSLYERFNIANDGVSAEELKSTALALALEVNERVEGIEYTAQGASVMPYTISQMNEILIESYKSLGQKYSFVQSFSSKIKPVMLSVPMSYTHTTGIYTFFTGEANLNVDFPDYTLTFTAAHELAHQRGIAREDEANFTAFLVGINSGDRYIEYSAYLNMFEYVSAALYRADDKMYSEVISSLKQEAIDEMKAYSRFFDKYRDSKAGQVSSALNNAYLIANGTAEGTKSYGLVVDLAVAYFNNDFE